MKHQSTMRSVLSGLAMAMAVATATATANAQTASDASTPSTFSPQSMPTQACGGQQRFQSGRHMAGEGHAKHVSHRMSAMGQGGMVGMGKLPASLVDQLSLTEKQKVALLDAQTAAQAMRESSKEIRHAHLEAIRKSASQDAFDPRAMIELQSNMRESMRASREAVQKKWLSFWDSLSKEQQAKVSEFMKQNMAQRGNRGMGPRAG